MYSEVSNYKRDDNSNRELSQSSNETIIRCGPVRRSCVLLLLYILLYGTYLTIGAISFASLEKPIHDNITTFVRDYLSSFKSNNTCVIDSDLEDLITEILKASNRGVSAIKNVTSEPTWSFGQSFFFASTIVTTIGYGHVHPLSELGKFFCIIYAIIGIPMTFILITAFVERLLMPATWLLHFMTSKFGHLYEPINIRVFHLAVIAGIGIPLFGVVPAIIFERLEPGWNYLDAFYYCFISLTTIGLGDYIPGDAREQSLRPLYKICITAYLLIGIAFVMLLLNLYNDIPQLNIGLFLLKTSDLSTDPERMHLNSGAMRPPKYNEPNERSDLQNVKVASRSANSPSPEEDPTSVQAIMHNQ